MGKGQTREPTVRVGPLLSVRSPLGSRLTRRHLLSARLAAHVVPRAPQERDWLAQDASTLMCSFLVFTSLDVILERQTEVMVVSDGRGRQELGSGDHTVDRQLSGPHRSGLTRPDDPSGRQP